MMGNNGSIPLSENKSKIYTGHLDLQELDYWFRTLTTIISSIVGEAPVNEKDDNTPLHVADAHERSFLNGVKTNWRLATLLTRDDDENISTLPTHVDGSDILVFVGRTFLRNGHQIDEGMNLIKYSDGLPSVEDYVKEIEKIEILQFMLAHWDDLPSFKHHCRVMEALVSSFQQKRTIKERQKASSNIRYYSLIESSPMIHSRVQRCYKADGPSYMSILEKLVCSQFRALWRKSTVERLTADEKEMLEDLRSQMLPKKPTNFFQTKRSNILVNNLDGMLGDAETNGGISKGGSAFEDFSRPGSTAQSEDSVDERESLFDGIREFVDYALSSKFPECANTNYHEYHELFLGFIFNLFQKFNQAIITIKSIRYGDRQEVWNSMGRHGPPAPGESMSDRLASSVSIALLLQRHASFWCRRVTACPVQRRHTPPGTIRLEDHLSFLEKAGAIERCVVSATTQHKEDRAFGLIDEEERTCFREYNLMTPDEVFEWKDHRRKFSMNIINWMRLATLHHDATKHLEYDSNYLTKNKKIVLQLIPQPIPENPQKMMHWKAFIEMFFDRQRLGGYLKGINLANPKNLPPRDLQIKAVQDIIAKYLPFEILDEKPDDKGLQSGFRGVQHGEAIMALLQYNVCLLNSKAAHLKDITNPSLRQLAIDMRLNIPRMLATSKRLDEVSFVLLYNQLQIFDLELSQLLDVHRILEPYILPKGMPLKNAQSLADKYEIELSEKILELIVEKYPFFEKTERPTTQC